MANYRTIQTGQSTARANQAPRPQPPRSTASQPAGGSANQQAAINGASTTEQLNSATTGGLGPFEAHQLDQKPFVIHRFEPVYPQAARRRAIEGWVEIRFLVDNQGYVQQERIIKAEPSGVFDNSALSALRRWQFSPGMLQGKAVETWVVQVVHFRLQAS